MGILVAFVVALLSTGKFCFGDTNNEELVTQERRRSRSENSQRIFVIS